jgi:hypothetical protein
MSYFAILSMTAKSNMLELSTLLGSALGPSHDAEDRKGAINKYINLLRSLNLVKMEEYLVRAFSFSSVNPQKPEIEHLTDSNVWRIFKLGLEGLLKKSINRHREETVETRATRLARQSVLHI